MNLSQNHFELFGLPERFAVDAAQLESRFRDLQREVHPDRHATASQAEQRVSMQLATRVNEAFQTLKSPVSRALYLLQLHGVDPQLETDTAMPRDFLVEQMELREALDEVVETEDGARLAALSSRLRGDRDLLLARLEARLDAHAWNDAVGVLRQLMFLEKFGEDIAAAEDDL